MSSTFVNAATISEASGVEAPSAACSLISPRVSSALHCQASSACLTRLRHSSSSDKRIQSGSAAAVSATPVDPSPLGENAQSSAARKLSISWA